MIEAFIENPILLLFVVAGVGYGLGSIRIRSSNLGVAAVLFVGLGFGSLNPNLHIPDIVIFLGLAIFVYTIGLSSGPSFFATFKQRGSRDIIFVILMLTFSASIAIVLHFVFQFHATTTAGLFAGSTTNTPSLAGLLDAISNSQNTNEAIQQMSEAAVIGYSLTYPMGVIGVMIAINLMQRALKIDYRLEEKSLKSQYPVKQSISSKTIAITKESVIGVAIRDLKKREKMDVVFGRLQRGEQTILSNWDTMFEKGDEVAIVGDDEELERVTEILGTPLPYRLSYDRSEYDTRRIFLSNPKLAGERLSTLNLNENYAAIITRVRRGDIDILANSETVLELGDRVRFVARKQDISKISNLFGDSIDALSRINLLSFGLGMGVGLLLGMITFQLPGGVNFKLGYAGGPMIVALILGALRRTGPIVWTLPYGANLTLRTTGADSATCGYWSQLWPYFC